MEEFLEDILMLTAMVSSRELNMLLMLQVSVLLILVSQLLQPSTQSHLLPQPSTLSLLLLQFMMELHQSQLLILQRLLRQELLTLLLLLLLKLQLREEDVMLLFLEEPQEFCQLPLH